jgi:hypothetical protein
MTANSNWRSNWKNEKFFSWPSKSTQRRVVKHAVLEIDFGDKQGFARGGGFVEYSSKEGCCDDRI